MTAKSTGEKEFKPLKKKELAHFEKRLLEERRRDGADRHRVVDVEARGTHRGSAVSAGRGRTSSRWFEPKGLSCGAAAGARDADRQTLAGDRERETLRCLPQRAAESQDLAKRQLAGRSREPVDAPARVVWHPTLRVVTEGRHVVLVMASVEQHIAAD